MSLARRLVLQQTRALLAFGPASSRQSVVHRAAALRFVSTTPRRLLAQPSHGHGATPPPSLNSNVNPYKGGPSAIDKAVHLFFFTEILRGDLT